MRHLGGCVWDHARAGSVSNRQNARLCLIPSPIFTTPAMNDMTHPGVVATAAILARPHVRADSPQQGTGHRARTHADRSPLRCVRPHPSPRLTPIRGGCTLQSQLTPELERTAPCRDLATITRLGGIADVKSVRAQPLGPRCDHRTFASPEAVVTLERQGLLDPQGIAFLPARLRCERNMVDYIR